MGSFTNLNSDDLNQSNRAHYLCNLLDCLIRLHDLVAGSYFPYPQPDLNTINDSLNKEIKRQIDLFNNTISEKIDFELPYEDYSLDDVRKNWLAEKRLPIHKIRFMLEAKFPPEGDHKMPKQLLSIILQAKNRLTIYELKRNEHNANTFRQILQNQKYQIDEENKTKASLFPDLDFDFIKDGDVKLALISFYNELRDLYFSAAIKSPIILSGSIIEALLKEAIKLKNNKAIELCKEKLKEKANICNNDIDDWPFGVLIDISFALEILPKDLNTQLNAVRNFRNFVHVHKVLSSGFQLDSYIKDICRSALFMVIDFINKWFDVHKTEEDKDHKKDEIN